MQARPVGPPPPSDTSSPAVDWLAGLDPVLDTLVSGKGAALAKCPVKGEGTWDVRCGVEGSRIVTISLPHVRLGPMRIMHRMLPHAFTIYKLLFFATNCHSGSKLLKILIPIFTVVVGTCAVRPHVLPPCHVYLLSYAPPCAPCTGLQLVEGAFCCGRWGCCAPNEWGDSERPCC